MYKRRVVVTGMGIVCPLGNSVREFWPLLVAGKSGVGPIDLFDASHFPTQFAGQVKGFDFDGWTGKEPGLRSAFRATFFALQAAEEAFQSSNLKSFNIDRERFGIYFGAGDSGIDFPSFVKTMADSFTTGAGGMVDQGRYLEAAPHHMNAIAELESQPFMTVTHLARYFDIRGPVSNSLTACAASSQAMGEAYEWIGRGDADIVMSGGSHSMIYPLGVAGFSLLTALSTRNAEPCRASRPFDLNRDGFVLAEGAGVVILEELSHARKRKAPIYGEIVGYGSTSDAYRLTDMDPEGSGAARAIEIAMSKAQLKPQQIDYINAHGTSTEVNDKMETLAIKRVMGERAYKIPVSSIKSMLGHMIAAAGVVEMITCLLAMRDSVIPPTINYEEPDPDCDLDYVPNQSRNVKVDTALSNSFGFGGQNICLAVKKYHE
ncbi:MAG: beta-ketoacyl-[acyl-carrier-protein] synthase family protein [Candidatus Omnitrophica bacterium]|nr:beta-ketoacyl-[acyl-carrier-protein] synthase family protein [Candidatus Omnitrophota bacterium]